MDWILNHIEAVLAVVAFLVAGWKAKKAGTLNRFLVQKVEGLATKQDKDDIKAQAVVVGVESLLSRTVANAGLSSTKKQAGLAKKALQTILPLALVALALGGCASTAYKDALRRIGDVGPRIANDIRPTDAGGEARKVEFLRLCDEARTLGSE